MTTTRFTAFLFAAIGLLGCKSHKASSVACLNPAVVNGQPATLSQLYATVSLIEDGFTVCTGTLIAPKVVLTASHCVVTNGSVQSALGIQVAAGALEVEASMPPQLVAVERIVPHENYNEPLLDELIEPATANGLDIGNDVALLFLAESITVVPVATVIPASLTGTALAEGKDVTLTGYGANLLVDGGPEGGGTLYIGTGTVEDQNAVEVLISPDPGEADTCSGDSGGPVYVEVDGRIYVAGVVSRGRYDSFELCGAGGIYSIASAYSDWILDNAPEVANTGCP